MHDKSFITIGLHHKKYQKGYEKTEEWRLNLKEIWVLKTKSLNHCQGTKHVRLIQSKESYLNCLDSSIACTSLIKIFNSNKTPTTFNDTILSSSFQQAIWLSLFFIKKSLFFFKYRRSVWSFWHWHSIANIVCVCVYLYVWNWGRDFIAK